MRAVVDRFGRVVGETVQRSPGAALRLLRTAYAASGLQMRVLPGRNLLPHQRYAAVACNRAIREPLSPKNENTAVVNVFLPCELLHAMGVSPQFAEGLACYLNGAGSERAMIDCAELNGVPQTFCSYHKVLLGAALSGVLPKPRLILNTTLACDANTCTFRTLAGFWKVPQFTIDVPDEDTPETVAYVAGQFRRATAFLEDVLGKKLDGDRLRASIRSENRSRALYRRALEESAAKDLPNDPTSEMYKLFLTHVLLGTGRAERYFRLMLKDVRRAGPAGEKKRILWVHTLPYWQDCVKGLFRSEDCRLLCCDLNFDCDAAMDEECPYESMAERLLQNTLRGPSDRRAEKLLGMAKLLRADGAVYFCHWGCKQTLGGAVQSRELLEREGFPTLLLDGDGCDRQNVNEGQMSTRLHAFLEILEAAK